MQNELDRLYCLLLTTGFTVLRQASEAQDARWVASELELLHNVPSLIGETKVGRQEYFWEQERTRYIEYVAASGGEMQKSRMRTYYEPIWREMEPLIVSLRRDA
jgi:hypothetical protein